MAWLLGHSIADILKIWYNTCQAPHFETSRERFTMATIVTLELFSAVCSSCVWLEWVTEFYTGHSGCPLMWLKCSLVVRWLVPCRTAAISMHIMCTPYNHALVYCVTSFEATMRAHICACVFSCNLPPALLAEWAGSFTCYCSNTGVEQILK